MPGPPLSARPRPVLVSGLPTRALLPGNDDRDLWTAVLLDGWVAACRHTVQDGHLVIAELRCYPDPRSTATHPSTWRGRKIGSLKPVPWNVPVPPGGGLSRRWLARAVAIGEHLQEVNAALRNAQRQPRGSNARKVQEWIFGSMVKTPLAAPSHPRGRGRPPLEEGLFLRVAAAYARAWEATEPRQVNHVVARRLGLPPARVRALVHQARNKYGFLSKADSHGGIPGGALTDLARSLLPMKPTRGRSTTRARRRRRR